MPFFVRFLIFLGILVFGCGLGVGMAALMIWLGLVGGAICGLIIGALVLATLNTFAETR